VFCATVACVRLQLPSTAPDQCSIALSVCIGLSRCIRGRWCRRAPKRSPTQPFFRQETNTTCDRFCSLAPLTEFFWPIGFRRGFLQTAFKKTPVVDSLSFLLEAPPSSCWAPPLLSLARCLMSSPRPLYYPSEPALILTPRRWRTLGSVMIPSSSRRVHSDSPAFVINLDVYAFPNFRTQPTRGNCGFSFPVNMTGLCIRRYHCFASRLLYYFFLQAAVYNPCRRRVSWPALLVERRVLLDFRKRYGPRLFQNPRSHDCGYWAPRLSMVSPFFLNMAESRVFSKLLLLAGNLMSFLPQQSWSARGAILSDISVLLFESHFGNFFFSLSSPADQTPGFSSFFRCSKGLTPPLSRVRR